MTGFYHSYRFLHRASQSQRDAARVVDSLNFVLPLLRPLRDIKDLPVRGQVENTDFDVAFVRLAESLFDLAPHLRKEAVDLLTRSPQRFPDEIRNLLIALTTLRERHDKKVADSRKQLAQTHGRKPNH